MSKKWKRRENNFHFPENKRSAGLWDQLWHAWLAWTHLKYGSAVSTNSLLPPDPVVTETVLREWSWTNWLLRWGRRGRVRRPFVLNPADLFSAQRFKDKNKAQGSLNSPLLLTFSPPFTVWQLPDAFSSQTSRSSWTQWCVNMGQRRLYIERELLFWNKAPCCRCAIVLPLWLQKSAASSWSLAIEWKKFRESGCDVRAGERRPSCLTWRSPEQPRLHTVRERHYLCDTNLTV